MRPGRAGLRRGALAVLVLALGVTALTACGGSSKPAALVMPDVVGMKVGVAEKGVYDELHTSLSYYDLSPADRTATNDWVVVATFPAAGEKTPKFKTVYAWALKASEYSWFRAHPTMPKIPAKATLTGLTSAGGLLAPVSDLVQLRYQPGKAPRSARPSPVDAAAFRPDRGVVNDLSLEPEPEWGLRKGLLLAPRAGTLAVGSRPAAGTELRVGQYLVLLGVPQPTKLPKPTGSYGLGTIDLSDVGRGPPGSGSPGSGSGSGGTGGVSGIKVPNVANLPSCPKRLCG